MTDEPSNHEYKVTILDRVLEVSAPDPIEAATVAIEELRSLKGSFEIGTILLVQDCKTNEKQYILAEIILANAGLYDIARKVGETHQKFLKSKKKKA
jgi:hypothetical protein